MLDDGVYATVSEIGDAENISKSYVSRILRLALVWRPTSSTPSSQGGRTRAWFWGSSSGRWPATWEDRRAQAQYLDPRRA